MGTVVAITFGLIVWIVCWAEGIKSFDGFLIAAFIALLALVGHTVAPLLPGNRGD